MANLKRKSPRVLSLSLRCSCGCRFSALAWGVKATVLAFCPSCGRFWSAPAVGRSVPWFAGSLPALPAPSLPPLQLALFD